MLTQAIPLWAAAYVAIGCGYFGFGICATAKERETWDHYFILTLNAIAGALWPVTTVAIAIAYRCGVGGK